ncbi:MAG: hypothetical protein KAI66_13485 [Lentisphaeria bacterium]|nr:hypothetical protein [Lentisphaeria bacterium]
MAKELVYTSAEHGLRPGTRGFCTVAYTVGMRPQIIQILEALSAYKNMYAVHDQRLAESPVSFSHYRYKLVGRNLSILSRVAPTSADHTSRSNKVAHHVVLGNRERIDAGPARLASRPSFFFDEWSREPHRIAEPKMIEDKEGETGTHAAAWEALTGDAGWAGVLAYSFLASAKRPAFLVFEPGLELLPLIAEALALLIPEQRWQVTYNTYFTALPAGASCAWRCCLPDSEMLREARRNPSSLVIDLTAPLKAPRENSLVTCAREGTPLPESAPSSSSSPKRRFTVLPQASKPRLRMRPKI